MTAAGGERPEPRIYVASLSDYNAGRLHGAWIDAAQEADSLADAVQAMLAGSVEPGAEEYAIHDYEGFGPAELSEWASLDRVALLGRGIAVHGEAFAAWASRDSGEPTVERFEAAYRGSWPSVEDYAAELLDDLGAGSYLEGVPDWLQPYVRIDTAGFSRDLLLSGDIAAVEGTNAVHIFEAGV